MKKYTVRTAKQSLIKSGATAIDAESIVSAADAKGYSAKLHWEQVNESETFTPSFDDRAESARASAFHEHIVASLENY